MGQSSIIMAVAVAIVLAVVVINTNKKVNDSTDKSVNYYAKNVAENICNSATAMLLSEVAEDKDFRVSDLTTKSMLGGTVNYKLIDTTLNGSPKLKIKVVAEYEGETAENILVATPEFNGFIPVGLKAAITTFNDIRTLGNLTVDGRDHDMNGKWLKDEVGVYGIWTTGEFDQDGSSRVGGDLDDKSYQPLPTAHPSIIKEKQSLPTDYTNTPDGVLGGYNNGFGEGTLKSLAQSGLEGGQYVTDPSKLKLPLSGVTYVELPSGSKWSNLNLSGSGVLIVHNSNTNAMVDNIQGSFTGVLIADNIDQIHGQIIGGVVGLSKDNTKGPAIGLGNGNVLYSSEAIKSVTKSTGKGHMIKGNYRLTIDYWLEK